jgi:hypothetical protein
MPKRIQRKRTKGWRLPEGAVCVTRPGRFGNPFPVAIYGIDLSLKLFSDTARGIWNPTNVKDLEDAAVAIIYDLHCTWMRRLENHPIEVIRRELKGKDLCCFCSLDQPCHADTLLTISNSC